MLKCINFSDILLFRNREKLNENFTELSLIYIKQITKIIGKSDRISDISDEFLINDKIASDKTFITNALIMIS